ncbi:MAG: alcohol dehydrogenase catalytic domain-containing protein [Pseudonocardiaceae bacterium]|nr:alcohol dehydrogenase catalytic domain-containing protein [Pseudonocardiaceae bacterium]
MRAATVVPGEPQRAGVSERPDPEPAVGELLVEGLLVGVCGTDHEVAHGGHGALPPGASDMVAFHESLGRVLTAPAGSGFAAGDLVAGVVRRPDPVPCGPCAAGEWDYCRNGRYTERGIKRLDGYGAQRWTVPAGFAVRVDPGLGDLGVLTEPASVVAKAWEQVDRISSRSVSRGHVTLVTGAGPIGLLAALLSVQRGLTTHVLDRATSGPKPDLVRSLGATYHSALPDDLEPDVVIEATGAAQLVFDVLGRTGPNAVTVLTGLSGSRRTVTLAAGSINDELVLDNDVVVGSVNANLRHYRAAADALAAADPAWLGGLLTRRVPLASWTDALSRADGDVKVIVDLRE